MNNSYINGKNVYLRLPSLEDLDGNWYKWFSDHDVTKFLVDRYWPNNQIKQRDFFDSIVNSKIEKNDASITGPYAIPLCVRKIFKNSSLNKFSSLASWTV